MASETSRSVCITGVSSGIGLAVARSCLQQGVQVYGSVRRKEDAGSLVAECGTQFTPLIMDITDNSQVQAAVRVVQAGLQGRTLWGLINNAGYAQGPDPLSLIPLDKLRNQLEVNLVAQLCVTQAFLPLLGTDLSRQGPPGRVCMMSSVYGSYSIPWNGPYCASKHALEGLSGALRQELQTYGIHVVVLRPGPIKTAIWEGSSSPESARDWHAYDDTDYAPAFAKTAKYKQMWLSDPRNFMAPEDVAACCWKAMCAPDPKAHYVVTPRPLENWYLPRWLPTRMVDGSLARRFGIRRLTEGARKDEVESAPLLRKEE